jgi:hypothetical protein
MHSHLVAHVHESDPFRSQSMIAFIVYLPLYVFPDDVVLTAPTLDTSVIWVVWRWVPLCARTCAYYVHLMFNIIVGPIVWSSGILRAPTVVGGILDRSKLILRVTRSFRAVGIGVSLHVDANAETAAKRSYKGFQVRDRRRDDAPAKVSLLDHEDRFLRDAGVGAVGIQAEVVQAKDREADEPVLVSGVPFHYR